MLESSHAFFHFGILGSSLESSVTLSGVFGQWLDLRVTVRWSRWPGGDTSRHISDMHNKTEHYVYNKRKQQKCDFHCLSDRTPTWDLIIYTDIFVCFMVKPPFFFHFRYRAEYVGVSVFNGNHLHSVHNTGKQLLLSLKERGRGVWKSTAPVCV